MSSERYAQLRLASGLDPVERLRQDLPPLWRGSVIGPGVAEWASLTGDGDRKLDLTGVSRGVCKPRVDQDRLA